MDGYVKLHRQLLESSQFADPIRLKIWIWCLIKANHKTRPVKLKIGKGFQTIQVKRGQFIFGRNKASEELDIPGSTVNRHMEKLVQEKSILVQPNNLYSLITIVKYNDYQSIEEIEELEIYEERTSNEQVTDNQRTTNGQLTDTNKNVNNVKKDKNKKNIPDEKSGNIKIDFKEEKVPTLHSEIIRVWFEEVHPDFVFSPIDGTKVKSIIKKIRELFKKKERTDSDEEVLTFFRLMCENLPEYYQDKDLKIIDSDFNQIIIKITQLKNGKQKTSSNQSTYESVREAYGS